MLRVQGSAIYMRGSNHSSNCYDEPQAYCRPCTHKSYLEEHGTYRLSVTRLVTLHMTVSGGNFNGGCSKVLFSGIWPTLAEKCAPSASAKPSRSPFSHLGQLRVSNKMPKFEGPNCRFRPWKLGTLSGLVLPLSAFTERHWCHTSFAKKCNPKRVLSRNFRESFIPSELFTHVYIIRRHGPLERPSNRLITSFSIATTKSLEHARKPQTLHPKHSAQEQVYPYITFEAT